MGCPIDRLNMEQTIGRIERYIKEKKCRQHVVVNAAKFVQARKDPNLRKIISECDLINADGMSIVWASRLLGEPLPERIAGIDLFQALIKVCADKGYRPFFFGARDWVVEKTAQVFTDRYPSLIVAGYRNGYFSEGEERGIAELIRNSRADILFVGFSSPMKENFLNTWIPKMDIPFCMGVGGSFDVIAGKTARAPLWMREYGLEWMYRFSQEPGRLWKRYALTNPAFIWIVLKEFIKSRIPS